MEKIQELEALIRNTHPHVEIAHRDRDWLDLNYQSKEMTVCYREEEESKPEGKGYGVWTPKKDEQSAYGEGPDETYRTPQEVVESVGKHLPH